MAKTWAKQRGALFIFPFYKSIVRWFVILRHTERFLLMTSPSHPEKRKMPDFETGYANHTPEEMPWYLRSLDPDVDKAFSNHDIPSRGHWLDLGTGTGTQALHLYEKGYKVTGTDISPSAIEHAKRLSSHIEWVVDDILNTKLSAPFSGILDRGVFHVFHAEERATYIQTVSQLLEPNGWLLLKCFSDKETMPEGPYRFALNDINTLFGPLFTVHKIEPSVFYGTFSQTERPIQALWCVMQKR